MKSSFVRSVTSLYAVQVATYVFPLLTFPYLTRTLGIAAFGQTQIAIAFAGLGAIVTDWGFNYSATHHIARAQGDKVKISKIAWNTISAKLILFFVWLALGFVLLPFNAKLQMSPLYFTLAMANVLAGALIPVWLYQGLERFSEISFTSLIARALATAAIFIAIHAPSDAPILLVIMAANSLLIAAYLWARVIRAHGVAIVAPNLREIWDTLLDSSQIFMTTSVISTYTTGAVLIVGALGGVQAAGAYAAVDRILSVGKSLSGPIVQVIYARTSALPGITRSEFLRETMRPMLLLSAAMLAAALALIFAGPIIFGLILKFSFAREVGILIPLALVLPIVSLTQWFVTVGLLARGLRRYWIVVIFSGPTVGLLFGLIFQHLFEPAVLVATAVLITEFTILVVGVWCWHRSWTGEVSPAR